MRILVVDDKPSVLDFVTELLEEQGFSVETANNGLSGLEKAQKHDFDLFIIDHLMPLMNGLQLSKNLSQQACGKNKPIVFMTTQGKNAVASLPEANLFTSILEKPLSDSSLLDALTLYLPENTKLHSL